MVFVPSVSVEKLKVTSSAVSEVIFQVRLLPLASFIISLLSSVSCQLKSKFSTSTQLPSRLRFPVWSRYNDDYDVLIYMANWPKPRILAWDSLLRARAIENMSYCIGVNRVGVDENQYEYIGHTSVYDFLGEKIADTEEGQAGFLECVLNQAELQKTRKKLNFLNDRDSFEIKL